MTEEQLNESLMDLMSEIIKDEIINSPNGVDEFIVDPDTSIEDMIEPLCFRLEELYESDEFKDIVKRKLNS